MTASSRGIKPETGKANARPYHQRCGRRRPPVSYLMNLDAPAISTALWSSGNGVLAGAAPIVGTACVDSAMGKIVSAPGFTLDLAEPAHVNMSPKLLWPGDVPPGGAENERTNIVKRRHAGAR
jgi:hypothetical protein